MFSSTICDELSAVPRQEPPKSPSVKSYRTIQLTAKKRPEYFSWDSLEDSSWTLSTDDRGAPERHISARGSQCALPQPKEVPKYHMKKCEENYRQMRDGGRAAGFHGLPGGLATGYRRISALPL